MLGRQLLWFRIRGILKHKERLWVCSWARKIKAQVGADVYLQTNLPCAPSSLSRERFLLRAGPKKYEGTNSSNQIPGRNRDDFVFRSVGPNSGLLASRESRDCSVFGTTFRDYFFMKIKNYTAKLGLTRKLTRFLPGFSQTAFSTCWQDFCTTVLINYSTKSIYYLRTSYLRRLPYYLRRLSTFVPS